MTDPLPNFDWSSLYARYDAMCKGFRPESPNLDLFSANRPQTDRAAYYLLINALAVDKKSLAPQATSLYEAVLYWKLYSQGLKNPQIWNA